MNDYKRVADDVELGQGVELAPFVNLYGCSIGCLTKVGAFVEIQRGAVVGKRCKISSHSFICAGVTIGDDCFIGHGVIFINDKYPRAVNSQGKLETEADWSDRFVKTRIGDKTAIGSGAVIMGGVRIGEGVVIGAGSVVNKNVPAGEVWVGNPARKTVKKVDRAMRG